MTQGPQQRAAPVLVVCLAGMEVLGEAGRAEDSTRSKPGARVFKQCREGESSGLCPCRVRVLGVMHGGSSSGCGVSAGKTALPWEKCALKELLSEKTLTLLQVASLVDFIFPLATPS